MDASQVSCVLEVADVRSFSMAARRLFMSPSSLSEKISSLEDEIGFRIFERSSKGVSLTPAGSAFCIRLRRVSDDLASAVEQGRVISEGDGTFSVCLPMLSCMGRLPRIAERFARAIPSVRLQIDVCYNGTDRLRALFDGRCAVCFSQGTLLQNVTNVRATYLFDTGFCAVVRKDGPLGDRLSLSVDDLAGSTIVANHRFMQRPCSEQLWSLYRDVLALPGIDVTYCSGLESALANVAIQGAVFLSSAYANDHRHDELSWIPLETNARSACYLVTRENDHRASTTHFIEIVREEYASQL
jgi:DNA-binding transcriptional LysR family regulator